MACLAFFILFLPSDTMKAASTLSVELLIVSAQQGNKAFININEALSADTDNQRRWQYCFVQG